MLEKEKKLLDFFISLLVVKVCVERTIFGSTHQSLNFLSSVCHHVFVLSLTLVCGFLCCSVI